MCDVPGLRLQEEEQVAVSLRFLVVGECPFLYIGGIFEMTGDFILLYDALASTNSRRPPRIFKAALTSSRAMRFWMSKAIRESRYRTSFSRTKFFLDCEEILDLRSRRIFWAASRLHVSILAMFPYA